MGEHLVDFFLVPAPIRAVTVQLAASERARGSAGTRTLESLSHHYTTFPAEKSNKSVTIDVKLTQSAQKDSYTLNPF